MSDDRRLMEVYVGQADVMMAWLNTDYSQKALQIARSLDQTWSGRTFDPNEEIPAFARAKGQVHAVISSA